ncbi:hypothetical protein HZB60_03350 [candidate division KSB1 bacterium]|nr:hypothetical protein [candidate division KSB1 bacterium]
MPRILILLLIATSAFADVTYKRKSSTLGFGASEGTATEYFTTDRSATESSTRWTRGMMKTMTGGKEVASTNIVRLDKELVWDVNPKEKEYKEMTFAEFRELIKKLNEDAGKAEAGEPVDTTTEDMYEWKVETLSDPNPKTINGFACKNLKLVATGTNKQDANDRVIITFDSWNCPAVPGQEEVTAFSAAYAKALGFDIEAARPGFQQAIMLYQKQFEQLAEAAKAAPGLAVTSLVEIKRNQLVGPKLGAVMKEGMKNEVIGKLPFGKKKEPKQEAPKYEERVKFSVQTELLEARLGAVEAAKFEVPAGFKLKQK